MRPRIPGNRAAIIDFTTGNKLTKTFINRVVQSSLDNSTIEAFAAYLQAWAKSDFSAQAQVDTATPVKLIVGVNDPALSANVMEQTWRVTFPDGRADHPARCRALPDVRVPGVARHVHRGVPGARMTPARPDTEVVFDPATYTEGVPFDALARLREAAPVAWVAEIPVLGWPEGPGFWLVLRHADVESVLTRPKLFSSALGATQIRDPATPQALGYVRRMMLNMDPPEHARLRRLLSRSFTPRAVAKLEDRIRGHARAICDRVFAGPRGEVDFAKDVAADLPLLTLADVLGVPEQDRWLLFDWSNRVIGYQDPDYASSAEFDPAAGHADGRRSARGAAVPR